MIPQVSAAIILAISFLIGMFTQDARSPLLILPFIMMGAWLLCSGRLVKLPLQDPVLLGFLGLWLTWAISCLHTPTPFNSRTEFLILSSMPASYIMWRAAEFSGRVRTGLIAFFLATAAYFSAEAILEITVSDHPSFGNRAATPFLDPNMLGVYLSMILLTILPVSLQKDLKLHIRVPLLVLLALLAAALIGTQSRSAVLGAGLGVALILWISKAGLRPSRTALVAMGGAVVAGAAMLFHTGFLKRFTVLFQEGGDQDFTSRFSIWGSALEMTMQNPLLGLGFGTFSSYYPVFREAGDSRSAGWWVHMDPLQWAVEAGWPAAIVFYVLVALIGRGLLQRVRAGGMTPLATGCAAALVALLFNAHTAYPLHVVAMMILMTGMITEALPRPEPSSGPAVSFGVAAPLFTACIIFISIAFSYGATLALWRDVYMAKGSMDQARFETALATCLVQGHPDFPLCKNLVVQRILDSGKDLPPELPKLIDEVIALDPLIPDTYYQRAEYFSRTQPDKPELEIAALEDCLKIDPIYLPARKRLSIILVTQNKMQEALDLLEAGKIYPIPRHEIPGYISSMKKLRTELGQTPEKAPEKTPAP